MTYKMQSVDEYEQKLVSNFNYFKIFHIVSDGAFFKTKYDDDQKQIFKNLYQKAMDYLSVENLFEKILNLEKAVQL